MDGQIGIDKNTNGLIQSFLIDTKLENSMYPFEWFLNGNKIIDATKSTYEALEIGTYSVIVTNKAQIVLG